MKTRRALLFLPSILAALAVHAADPTDRDAIRALYPQLSPVRDFSLNADGSLNAWKLKDKRFPAPTAAQLTAAKAQVAAQWQIVAQIKSALRTQFAALPAGEQALYQPVLQAVSIKLNAGDLAGAKQIIATAPTPTATLQAAQTAMLALFPS